MLGGIFGLDKRKNFFTVVLFKWKLVQNWNVNLIAQEFKTGTKIKKRFSLFYIYIYILLPIDNYKIFLFFHRENVRKFLDRFLGTIENFYLSTSQPNWSTYPWIKFCSQVHTRKSHYNSVNTPKGQIWQLKYFWKMEINRQR